MVKQRFEVSAFVIGVLLGAIIMANLKNGDLRQQREQTQKQIVELKANAGRPIFVGELMDGQYARCDDKHYALVQHVCDFPIGAQGPAIAVSCSAYIPESFTVKNGKAEGDFLNDGSVGTPLPLSAIKVIGDNR